jgi:hypothetical protein
MSGALDGPRLCWATTTTPCSVNWEVSDEQIAALREQLVIGERALGA